MLSNTLIITFQVLTTPLDYDLRAQVKMIYGIMALHNYVRSYDPQTFVNDVKGYENSLEVTMSSDHPATASLPQRGLQRGAATRATQEANEWRDQVAQRMWDKYVAYKARQRQ
jgi:hypothetical protein